MNASKTVCIQTRKTASFYTLRTRLELDFSIWLDRSPVQTNPAPAQQHEWQLGLSFLSRKHIIRDDRTTVLPFWQKTAKTRLVATQRSKSGCRTTKLLAPKIKPARLKSRKKSLIWNINRRRRDIGTFAADLGDKTCGI